jgi:RNase P subunit RPR2
MKLTEEELRKRIKELGNKAEYKNASREELVEKYLNAKKAVSNKVFMNL